MVRGVSFLIPNKRFPALSQILESIDIQKYIWVLAENDVLNKYFKSISYAGDEFQTLIQNEDFYSIALNLQAFPCEKDIKPISNYGEYLSSGCRIVLLIYDAIYVEVYAKDPKTLQTITCNASNHLFESIEPITDENDMRTGFSLFG